MLDRELKENFLAILKEELIPAMGCTEPIALAYAAAVARACLGKEPERILARCSGNIVKNVRCVAIPNSGGMIGIEAAVALGALGGDASRVMEVLESVKPEHIKAAEEYVAREKCQVEFLDSEIPLHFIIREEAGEDWVEAEVRHSHTNIVSLCRNGVELKERPEGAGETGRGLETRPEGVSEAERELETRPEKAVQPGPQGTAGEAVPPKADRSRLSIEAIKQFADEIDIHEIKDLYDEVIQCNMNIAYEGMAGDYGLGIGRMIREQYPESVITRMKAFASAASEARMDGCEMPVIINSGSGNQGIASSVPVIVYAREKNIPQERLYRSLVFSSLLTIYQKEFIGKLSAFCGAVSASCAAGVAITYMVGGTERQIKDTIGNTLANIPGIICDGAKISCAAKIASSIDAAMMAHFLAMQGKAYEAYTGILQEEAGETISCVGYIGKVGMRQTDKEIIKMMLR